MKFKITGKNTRNKKTKRHPLRKTRPSPFLKREDSNSQEKTNNIGRLSRVISINLSDITGKERKKLRGEAHHLKPSIIIGANGITKSTVFAVDEALRARQLIKVRFHEPDDKKFMSQELAKRVGAILVGLIGHTAILYRPNKKEN